MAEGVRLKEGEGSEGVRDLMDWSGGKDRAGTGAPDCIRPARLAPSEPRRPVANRRSSHSPPGDRGSNRSLTLLSSHPVGRSPTVFWID